MSYISRRPDQSAAASATEQTGRAVREQDAITASHQEFTMQTPSPFHKPLEQPTGRKFAQMTLGQKFIFVAKLAACIATFGFAFPNVQHD